MWEYSVLMSESFRKCFLQMFPDKDFAEKIVFFKASLQMKVFYLPSQYLTKLITVTKIVL